jgi:RHS repeat-associated protein
MAERAYTTSNIYRYGFNGKETDKESSTQDYGMRIYNPALGRFLSVDPIATSYPWYTPFQFSGNMPILMVDLDGLEPKKGEINFGKNILLGLVNGEALKDKFLLKNTYGAPKRTNENWITSGSGTDIISSAEFLSKFKAANPEVKVENVVFTTHGGATDENIGGLFAGQGNNKIQILARDIEMFLDNDPKLSEETKKAIGAFESVLSNIEEGGTFVLNACNCGKDDNLGVALQKLAKGRVNIYLSTDKVAVPISKESPELDVTKIKEGNLDKVKRDSHEYKKGFKLFPAGYIDESKKTPNTPIEINKNLIFQSQDEPIKKQSPLKKK